MRTGRVYALYDVRRPGEYRYVGRTVQTLERRLHKHGYGIKDYPHMHSVRWFKSIGWHNVRIIELGAYPESRLRHAESMWMAALREAGHELTNVAPGGSGSGFPVGYFKHSDETKARISASGRGTSSGRYWLGRARSEEDRRRISEGVRRAPTPRKSCLECGMTTTPGALSSHQRRAGHKGVV